MLAALQTQALPLERRSRDLGTAIAVRLAGRLHGFLRAAEQPAPLLERRGMFACELREVGVLLAWAPLRLSTAASCRADPARLAQPGGSLHRRDAPAFARQAAATALQASGPWRAHAAPHSPGVLQASDPAAAGRPLLLASAAAAPRPPAFAGVAALHQRLRPSPCLHCNMQHSPSRGRLMASSSYCEQ